MKLPAWDNTQQRWDKFEAFHIGVDKYALSKTNPWTSQPFIMFDSGEVVCTYAQPGPDQRGIYPMLNLQLVGTNDRNCPALATPDGEAVAKAWLDDAGQQYLLIDLCTSRAYRLGGGHSSKLERVPERLSHFTAYFPGAGREPTTPPVTVAKPDLKALTREEREHKDAMISSIKAATKLVEDHPANKPLGYWAEQTLRPLDLDKVLACASINDLPADQQRALLKKGTTRRIVRYPYFNVVA